MLRSPSNPSVQPAKTIVARAVTAVPSSDAVRAHPSPRFSDDALALLFAKYAKDSFRWVPGLDWLCYDGVVWSRDDRLTRMTLVRKVCRAEARVAEGSEKKRLTSAATVTSVLALAKSDPALVITQETLDSNPRLLNTPDGVVDLAKGTLRYRLDDEYFTQVTNVSPEISPCPRWHQFLEEAFQGDAEQIEFIRCSLGYFLTGDRSDQYLFFWHGKGRNGKSVLVDLVLWIMGTYAITLPSAALMQPKGERHPTEIAQLRGVRLAMSSELDEGDAFNAPLVKRLTGDETMEARLMHKDYFRFRQQQKHLIVGNFKPKVRGGDRAMAERLLLVPFDAYLPPERRDPNLLEKLKAEAPGILYWMMGGAVAWHATGLAIPTSVKQSSAEYMADNDDLALWLEECCIRTGTAGATALYTSFRNWKDARGESAPSQTAWGPRLLDLQGVTKRMSNGARYDGISLKPILAS